MKIGPSPQQIEGRSPSMLKQRVTDKNEKSMSFVACWEYAMVLCCSQSRQGTVRRRSFRTKDMECYELNKHIVAYFQTKDCQQESSMPCNKRCISTARGSTISRYAMVCSQSRSKDTRCSMIERAHGRTLPNKRLLMKINPSSRKIDISTN